MFVLRTKNYTQYTDKTCLSGQKSLGGAEDYRWIMVAYK